MYNRFNLNISVVSQEDEALLTANGCYNNIQYKRDVCIFIGGGSIELIFVKDGEITERKYYDFGVVDVTNKYSSLKDDCASCTFDEVYSYIDSLIGKVNIKCDLLILAGGDHLYWYNNAGYELNKNDLYKSENPKYMITTEMSDKYDRDALKTSLDKIKEKSNNPLWFNGSRTMKAIANVISHKINAKYIVPTKINMEDGIYKKIIQGNTK